NMIEPRLLEIGTPFFENSPSEVYTGVNIETPSWESESSTFSGWGSIVGVLPKFNKITLGLRGWKEDELPTQVRIRIKKDNYQGEVLFDQKFDFLPIEDKMTFEVPTIEYNSSLYIEYLTNGRIGIYRGVGTSTGARYATAKDPDASTTSGGGSSRKLWVEYSYSELQFRLTEQGVEYFGSHLSTPLVPELSPIITKRIDIKHTTTPQQLANYESSTFTGWGCGVGVISEGFNGIELYVHGWKPDELPTQIR